MNGSTAPTHGVGSRTGCPEAGSVSGHQCPGAVLGTHCEGPNRPSSSRAAIITLAAASPAAIPFTSRQPSGMSARASAYCLASVSSMVARLVSGRFFTVDTMSRSTPYAATATATAASSEARAEKRFFSR